MSLVWLAEAQPITVLFWFSIFPPVSLSFQFLPESEASQKSPGNCSLTHAAGGCLDSRKRQSVSQFSPRRLLLIIDWNFPTREKKEFFKVFFPFSFESVGLKSKMAENFTDRMGTFVAKLTRFFWSCQIGVCATLFSVWNLCKISDLLGCDIDLYFHFIRSQSDKIFHKKLPNSTQNN